MTSKTEKAEVVRTRPGYHLARDERDLTDRQRAVMGLLAQGKNMSAIGTELGISRQRVSSIVKMLVEKGWVLRNGAALAVVVHRAPEQEEK